MEDTPFSLLHISLLSQLSWLLRAGRISHRGTCIAGGGMEIRHMVRKREMKGRTSWQQVKGASQGQFHFSFTEIPTVVSEYQAE